MNNKSKEEYNQIKKKVVEFYSKNKNKYKTIGTKYAKAFLEENQEIDINFKTLSEHYFVPLIKGKEIIKQIIPKGERVVEEKGDERNLEYKGEQRITTLQEAIDFFEVDLNIWEVRDWKCKSWDTTMKLESINEDGRKTSTPTTKTNYLVNVNLKKKEIPVDYEAIYKHIDEWVIPKPLTKGDGNRIGVLTIADLHAGLKISKANKVVNTPDYNIEILKNYLAEISERVNSLHYKELHLVILGDLVESVTGYNKLETLKEMEYGLTGGNLIIVAYEIIHKFVLSLKNVKKLYMISGNHDRLTPDKAMDKDGGAAQLVAYMLGKTIEIEWHPIIMNTTIDDISYILTHGDHNLSKGDLGKIFFEYGKQDMYNVMLSGHWHIRKSSKIFQEKNTIMVDTRKYRAITVPPLTTGNRWTEEMGYSCTSGFTITEANSAKTNINHFDYALN